MIPEVHQFLIKMPTHQGISSRSRWLCNVLQDGDGTWRKKSLLCFRDCQWNVVFFHHGSPSFLWGNPNMYARMFFVKVQHPFETKSRDNARPYFYSFYPFFPISAQCVCVILCVRACVCRIICYQVFFHHTTRQEIVIPTMFIISLVFIYGSTLLKLMACSD